jgi:hypothetical protein
LSDILGFVTVSQQIGGGTNEAGAMATDQPRKRSLVASTASGNKLSLLDGRINRG